ncbi:hypothetical protein D9M69_670470 [compost metagenome]
MQHRLRHRGLKCRPFKGRAHILFAGRLDFNFLFGVRCGLHFDSRIDAIAQRPGVQGDGSFHSRERIFCAADLVLRFIGLTLQIIGCQIRADLILISILQHAAHDPRQLLDFGES